MLSENLLEKLNRHVAFEFASANLYLAMAAYFESESLEGFANFFRVQVQEEHFHAMKFFDYINNMGGRARIYGIAEPRNDFSSPLELFQVAYEHEQLVTKTIYSLMDTALEEKEHATISFLKWFIDEQIEEEATFSNIVKQLKRIDNNGNGLYLLDAELAKRVFTPPINV